MAIPSSSLTFIGEVPSYVPATRLVVPTRQIWSSSALNPVSDFMPSSLFLLDKATQQGSDSLVASLKGTLTSWLAKDDVFTVNFLRRLYLVASDVENTAGIFESHSSRSNLDELLHGWGTSFVHLIDATSIAHGDLTHSGGLGHTLLVLRQELFGPLGDCLPMSMRPSCSRSCLLRRISKGMYVSVLI